MRRNRRAAFRSGTAGFTLIETLIATALMVAILAALATVTAQWLPNWKRGFARVQRTELAGLGLERTVADLAAAEFVSANAEAKSPLFDGAALSVIFVRSALGPNAGRGLEIVRIAETADARGLALVRMRAPFAPLPPGSSLASLAFADPVVLLRAPYRMTFSYAGPDRVWHDTWREPKLPSAVRVLLRDSTTAQPLALSTATIVHVTLPAECIKAQSVDDCFAANPAAPNNTPGAPNPAAPSNTPGAPKAAGQPR
jgi:general secretion pathway protein J